MTSTSLFIAFSYCFVSSYKLLAVILLILAFSNFFYSFVSLNTVLLVRLAGIFLLLAFVLLNWTGNFSFFIKVFQQSLSILTENTTSSVTLKNVPFLFLFFLPNQFSFNQTNHFLTKRRMVQRVPGNQPRLWRTARSSGSCRHHKRLNVKLALK